jgi:hypothetical protein
MKLFLSNKKHKTWLIIKNFWILMLSLRSANYFWWYLKILAHTLIIRSTFEIKNKKIFNANKSKIGIK